MIGLDPEAYLQGVNKRVLFTAMDTDSDPCLLYGGVHRVGPHEQAIRYKNHFTVHVVLAGSAAAGSNNDILQPGDGYVYVPRQQKILSAPGGDCMWAWIGFNSAHFYEDCQSHDIHSGVIRGAQMPIRQHVERILSELAQPTVRSAQVYRASLDLIIAERMRVCEEVSRKPLPQHKCIARAQQIINSESGVGIGVAELAQAVGLERSYFSRLFRKQVGVTVRDALAAAQLRLAENLLADDQFSIRAVAEISGFEEYFTFHRFYKRHRGMSPSAYRKQCRATCEE